jgi:hypothetical protein
MTWNQLVDQILSTLTEEERGQEVRMMFYLGDDGYDGREVDIVRAERDEHFGWPTEQQKAKQQPFVRKGEPYLC